MAKRKAASTRKASAPARGRAVAGRKSSARKTARKAAGRTAVGRKAASPKIVAKKRSPLKAAKTTKPTKTRAVAGRRKTPARPRPENTVAPASTKATARSRQSSRQSAEGAGGRKAPALDRVRRTVPDDDIVPTPPSSLDLDRSASAVRTGRHQLRERYNEHTETSPTLTGGDVDADWESAYSVGDEAPGGDNPTPDQDIVDDIGRAVGNEYQDTEELKGADKIAKRDKHRWELDPASSEDYDERKR